MRGQFDAATTGSDGTYRINNVAPGSYQVCFTPDNTAAGTPPTGYAAACHAGDVTVTDGHTTAGVNGVLPHGAAVSGRVTAATDAAAITNVEVQVHYTGDNGDVDAGFANTAMDGTYRIIGLTGGTAVTVCFSGAGGTGGPSPAGYLNACYHTGAGTDPTPVTVTAGSTKTGIDVALASGGGISGTVRGGTAGVVGIDVDVVSADGLDHYEAESGTDGTLHDHRYGAGDVHGVFRVRRRLRWHRLPGPVLPRRAWDGGSVPTGVDPVTVTAGNVTENIDASLTPY